MINPLTVRYVVKGTPVISPVYNVRDVMRLKALSGVLPGNMPQGEITGVPFTT